MNIQKNLRLTSTSTMKRISAQLWRPKKLRELLGRMANRKILVIGDVGLDRYTFGTVDRICPEAPVPVVLVQKESLKLGLAANVAENIRELGGHPLLVGIIGKDNHGLEFVSLSRHSKIPSSHLIIDPKTKTVFKERVISDGQQLLRIDYENCDAITLRLEKTIIRKIQALLPTVQAVILQDYAKGLMSERLAQKLITLSHAQGVLVSADPNANATLQTYYGCDVLTPNLKESSALSGIKIKDEATLIQAGISLLEKTQCRHLVVTRGKDGMAVFQKGSKKVTLIPTSVREVYDVSGAGDTVIAIMTMALASGAEIEEAAILGNLGAGVVVGKTGTATVSTKEICDAIEFFCRGSSK